MCDGFNDGKFAADTLNGAWSWSVMRRALLSVTPAPDRLALPTIAGSPFDSANWFTKTSVRIPRVKARVPKVEPRSASKKVFRDNIADERGIREERKQKKYM